MHIAIILSISGPEAVPLILGIGPIIIPCWACGVCAQPANAPAVVTATTEAIKLFMEHSFTGGGGQKRPALDRALDMQRYLLRSSLVTSAWPLTDSSLKRTLSPALMPLSIFLSATLNAIVIDGMFMFGMSS